MNQQAKPLHLSASVVDVINRFTGEAEFVESKKYSNYVLYFDNETRYTFEEIGGGWIRVSLSVRSQPESFVCDFASMEYADRYFAMMGGGYLRDERGLGRLNETMEARAVAAGTRVEPGNIQVGDRLMQIESVFLGDQPVARFPARSILRDSEAAGASWFLKHETDQIIASQLDSAGKPVFSLRPDVL